jgi:hypothetical protein
MQDTIRNIYSKTVALTAIIAVILLNFTAVVNCGGMFVNENCCHTTNIVKPCCVKNLKITADERLTGACGCSMKEAPQKTDLYNDISTYQNRNQAQKILLPAVTEEVNAAALQIKEQKYYSPPEYQTPDTYLKNMNLRI